MTEKKLYSTGTVWEEKVGYSRAVQAGNMIFISGTTAVTDGKVVGIDNPYEQTKIILEKIKTALEQFNSSLKDVVRVRIFVTKIDHFEQVGSVLGEYFKDIKPAMTLMEVSAFVVREMLIEIEADAVI
ncbi:MAG TPA: RidA family protein [Ignavibacteria bacterium]|nr:RidA family protein [Ignavibacteria bacterium]